MTLTINDGEMETLQELLKIDDTKFELLVESYLRRREPRLVGLIGTGINAEGKPIPCPVDGVAYVPGEHPACILVAYTTMSRDELRRKWLGGKGRKGDLAKANNEFEKWRQANSEITCILYLATNRPLGNDVALYREVVQQGRATGIEVQVIEASRLVDYLDHDADGQYLRQELLGINAARMSEALLRRIASRSLSYHRRTFALVPQQPGQEIEREAHSRVLAALDSPGSILVGIRGASGTGKSTLLRQVGEQVHASGGIALWVPAEAIVTGSSLATLLLHVLQRFAPSVDESAGDDAMTVAQSLPGGLVLLVDDINRLPDPRRAFAAIHAWVTPSAEEKTVDSPQGRIFLRFVVPLWPGQLAVDFELQAGATSGWQYVDLQTYSLAERAQIARSLSRSGVRVPETRGIVDLLNGDPFLCGLASSDLPVASGVSRSQLISDIFSNVVRRAVDDALSVLTANFTATRNELALALDGLVRLMLVTNEPEPLWAQVRRSLGDRDASLLLALAGTNRLGWIDQRAGDEVWRWKHSRLRDALVGRWLAEHFSSQVESGWLDEQTLAWMRNPGLAEAWALAVSFLLDPVRQEQAITYLDQHVPLALAVMLRLGICPPEVHLRRLVQESLHRMLEDSDERTPSFVVPPPFWILRELASADDSLVVEILDATGPSWNTWEARFRNGEISSGLAWIASVLAHGDFAPTIHSSWLERAVERFALRHDQGRDHVASELARVARQPDSTAAALTLAGYLAWPELALPLWQSWSTLDHPVRLRTLVPAVWALSRCGDESAQVELEEALLLASELSQQQRVEGKVQHGSDRFWQFMEPLWLARHWPITDWAAITWARVAQVYPDLRETMCYLLRGVDHPIAIETYVRWSAEEGARIWDAAFEPIDPLAEPESPSILPKSPPARDRLWEMSRNDPKQKVRTIAFSFWKRAITSSDLGRLRAVQVGDPLFDAVLKARLKLHDRTAAELLVQRVRSDPKAWCGYAPLLQDQPGVMQALLDNFESALEDTFGRSEYVPEHLRPDAVRRLVGKKRELLLRLPRVWPSLWRSDVPEALALVQDALAPSNRAPTGVLLPRSGVSFSYVDAYVKHVGTGCETLSSP